MTVGAKRNENYLFLHTGCGLVGRSLRADRYGYGKKGNALIILAIILFFFVLLVSLKSV